VDPVDNPTAETIRPLGQELAAERERQGLSRAEVAQRLHMSQWQIEALESGDYARLPKGTFLRGFLRNYAKILGLDGEAMLARLAETAPKGPAPGIVVPSQNIRFDPIGDRLANPYVKAGGLAVVFIALGFAVMYWWLFIRPAPPAVARKDAPAPQNIAAAPVPAPDPVAPAPARIEPAPPEPPQAVAPRFEPSKAEPPKAEPPKAEPPKAAATVRESIKPVAAQKAADRTLKLRFKGESWVEVRDRSGKVLLSKLNPPGTEAEVSGRPPFNVVIGNAPLVQVLYEDREFPLEPHTRVAVARFTVE
jgi:cytoskeleton protein RodZ